MTGPKEDATQPDDETREESSKQRNITAPTPPDVRSKGEDEDEEEDASTDERAR